MGCKVAAPPSSALVSEATVTLKCAAVLMIIAPGDFVAVNAMAVSATTRSVHASARKWFARKLYVLNARRHACSQYKINILDLE